jgi:RNA polymerase sigma-70 factor (sigma-E family)
VRTTQEVVIPSAAESGGRLAELYERHVGRAVGLARLLTGEPDAAEDIAHDAFIRAAGRFAHLRDQASFETYYRRAVVNACRARLRRSRVERQYLRRSIPASTAASDVGPEERDRLWAAIRRLPERQRAAVVLRFYEDLSEDQTAAVLKCSPRAVNSLVSRAMTQLRSDINEEES